MSEASFTDIGWGTFLSSFSSTPSFADSVDPGTQVRIVVMYHDRDLTRLHQLEDELDAAATTASAGQLDGDEVAVDGIRHVP